jgi:cytochrome c oxidase subunit 2
VGHDIHGSIALELIWTFIPFVLAMVMFFWGADLFFNLSRPPADSMDVFVVGNRVKMDAVPGKLTTMWFRATKPGTYHIFCAEYCGTQHSGMIGQVIAMEPHDYEAWLAGGRSTGSAVENGEKLFTALACITCHKPDASGRGPVLAGVFGSTVQLMDGRKVVVDENYLRESIMNPQSKIVLGYQPIMPTFQGTVSEENLLQLIAYIKTLKAPAPKAGAPGAAGHQGGQ